MVDLLYHYIFYERVLRRFWALKLIKLKVQTFLGYITENCVYTARSGLAKGLKRRGGLGFIPMLSLTEEERLLTQLDLKGKTVYDVGAASGLFTIYFSYAVGETGRVVAFEPNPQLCSRLEDNLNINGFSNVTIRQLALGHEKAMLQLTYLPFHPGTGTTQASIRKSFETRAHMDAKTINVQVDLLDNQIQFYDLPKPDLVKVDVNGVELQVLKGMEKTIQTCHPKLLLEVHALTRAQLVKNSQKIIAFAIEHGYTVLHIETGKLITSKNSNPIREWGEHLYFY